MGYSNVGTPVFYVDNYLYHSTIGTQLDDVTQEWVESNLGYSEERVTHYTAREFDSLFKLKPNIATEIPNPDIPFTGGEGVDAIHIGMPLPEYVLDYNFSGNMKWYTAFLNHAMLKFQSETGNYTGYLSALIAGGNNQDYYGTYINDHSGSNIHVESDPNYTISYPVQLIRVWHFAYNTGIPFPIGAISTGIQYTMPTSPDLKLSMDIEIEGIKNTATLDGSSLTNIEYTGNPLWYNWGNYTNPFEIYYDIDYDVRQTGAIRHGRKKWNLKFSYMSDKDLFAANMKSTYYSEHGTDGTMSDQYDSSDIAGSNDEFMHTMETDDSFVAQVWNKTLGGGLPFIFQPNSNNRDDFYICKFDQSSLKISQSAFNVYDISLKIEEVW